MAILMKLSEILEQRIKDRPCIDVPLSAIITADGLDDLTFKVRALSVAEETEATEAALEFRKKTVASIPETHAKRILEDESVLEDAKYTERIWRACRDFADTERPAFPSADWMRKHFVGHEMGLLAEWFGRAQLLGSKQASVASEVAMRDLAEVCANSAESPYPDQALASMPRSSIASFCIWLCVRNKQLEAELDHQASASA